MTQSSIRLGAPSDLPAVAAMLEAATLPTADLAGATQLQLWVLEVDGALQGAIALERFGGDGLLRSLVVAPGQRRRGLGRQLIARLEQDAAAAGIKELVLLTETAEPIFRTLGYAAIDRSSVNDPVKDSAEFRSLCPASAVCMRKVLQP